MFARYDRWLAPTIRDMETNFYLAVGIPPPTWDALSDPARKDVSRLYWQLARENTIKLRLKHETGIPCKVCGSRATFRGGHHHNTQHYKCFVCGTEFRPDSRAYRMRKATRENLSLAFYLRRQGLTCVDISEIVGVHPTTVQSWFKKHKQCLLQDPCGNRVYGFCILDERKVQKLRSKRIDSIPCTLTEQDEEYQTAIPFMKDHFETLEDALDEAQSILQPVLFEDPGVAIGDMPRCPECHSTHRVRDYMHGESFCGECGLVLRLEMEEEDAQ